MDRVICQCCGEPSEKQNGICDKCDAEVDALINEGDAPPVTDRFNMDFDTIFLGGKS